MTGAARMAKRLGVLAWGLWALAMLGLAGLVLDAARKGGAHLG